MSTPAELETLREERADPVLIGRPSDLDITETLLAPSQGLRFFWPLVITGSGALVFITAILYTVTTGIGVWGNNNPVHWALGITHFVWWIGIGHAGTFISAFLLLLEQQSWRTSINRFAEGMTLFAVMCAGVFPLIHMGRSWFFYWLFPYPSTMGTWPQFRSALAWDVAAIGTYFTVSLLFFYVGLLPDLATARELAPTLRQRRIYGFFALGWRGSARHWHHYRTAYALLAGLATPLVISVHSIVSLDFAISKVPGWHATIFPPYFVAGAVFSGFAMVFTLLIPARRALRLENVVTLRHLESMAKVTLLTGSVVAYSYVAEAFSAWYSGDHAEAYVFGVARPRGTFAPFFWAQVVCNVVAPQALWFRRVRRSPAMLFGLSLLIHVGMWLERFMIVVSSLARDNLPSSWANFRPSLIDGALFFGSVSFFLFLFLLFLRWVPPIPISETKELRHELEGHEVIS